MASEAASSVEARPAAYRPLLRDRSFRNLLLAGLTSSFGDWIGLFAIIALTEELEGATRAGALSVALVLLARVTPTLALGPVAGVFADRWDRKRTMIATDVVRGLVMFSVAFVGDVFQLIVATFVIEVASTLFIPAKDATVPNVVPRGRLVQANQLNLIATYGTLPVGALLFAGLVALTGQFGTGYLAERPVVLPIVINALTFLVSALFIRGIVLRDPDPEELAARARRTGDGDEPSGAWQELQDGLRFIRDMPLIRALVVGVMTAFVAAGFVFSLGSFFATIINAGDVGFGVLAFAVGVGFVGGLAVAGPLTSRLATERLFAPGIGVAGGSLVVTALMPGIGFAFVPALAMGIGAGLAFVTGYTLIQSHTDDELRGRTFAVFNTAVRAALFLSLFVGPLLVLALGVEGPSDPDATVDGDADEVLEDALDEDAVYDYEIGGVRLTLIMGGLVGVVGSVWSGRAVHQVLSRREEDEEVPTRLSDVPAGGPPASWADASGGVFVTFEGGDGAGKSTQVRLLRAAVERTGREVVVTREPGGTVLAEQLRELVLDPRSRVGPRAEALIYAAARAQHVDDVIRPALERGAVVLCDRFVDSSVAYQGVGRELGGDLVGDLNRWGTAGLVPDLTVLVDVDAEVGVERAGRGGADRLEGAGIDFHRTVNAAFRRLAEAEPDRYLVVDAALPVESLHARIRDRVLELVAAADAAVEREDAGPDDGEGTDRDADVEPAGGGGVE